MNGYINNQSRRKKEICGEDNCSLLSFPRTHSMSEQIKKTIMWKSMSVNIPWFALVFGRSILVASFWAGPVVPNVFLSRVLTENQM